MRRLLHLEFLLSAFLMCLHGSHAWAQREVQFKTAPLSIGIHVIQAQVAATQAQREHGLMYREKLATNEGMVFVFEAPLQICMWMKNTPLPLSVAFMDEAGKIVNIEDMQPHTTDNHCAAKPVKYALEMNQGWFRKRNIKAGAVVEGLPH